MVEVFKTNVTDCEQAARLLEQIHHAFSQYEANFDLEDCDKILRVKCRQGNIQTDRLVDFIRKRGIEAEVLPDEPAVARMLP